MSREEVPAPVEQAKIVGGRGRHLVVSREGSSRRRVEVKVTLDLGAMSKKVSGNVFVDCSYTLYFVAGFNFATTRVLLTGATIVILHRDSQRRH